MQKKPTYEELEKELEILKGKANPQTLLEFSGLLFVEINPKGIVTLVNNKTCEVLGYEEKEIVGKNWFENFIPKRTKKELLSVSKKIISGEVEKVEHFENPILTKNKEERVINWHNTAIKDKKGTILGHVSLGEDITERKKTEAELIKLNTAVNSSIHEVHIFDADNLKFTFVNEVSIKNLGYTFEELIKMSPVDVTPEYEHKDALKKLAPLRSGKINKLQFETYRQRKDKTTYPVEINVSKFYIKDKLYFLALIIDITERKKTEKEIQQAKEKAEKSEHKLKEAQQIAHLGHWELDIKNNKLTWSDEVYRILNLNPKKVRASEDLFMELVHPDDRDKLNKVYSESVKNKKPYQIKYKLSFKSGKIKHILGEGITEYSDSGEPIFSIGTILDITEQKMAEEKLQKVIEEAEKSEKHLKEAQEIACLGHWEIDIVNNNLTTWSDEVYRIFNLKPQEIEASDDLYMHFIHPEDRNILNTAYSNSVKNKKPYEVHFRLLFQSGELKHIRERGITEYSREGKPIRSIGTTLDITAQKNIEQILEKAKEASEKSEAKFKQLSNLTFEGILIHDNGFVIDINLSLSKMLGYKPEELIGKNIIDLFVPKKHHEIILKSIVKNYTLPFEIEGIKKDGTIFPVEIEARNFISDDNKELRVAAVRDITQRKKFEAENIKLSTIVEQSSNCVIITDVKGDIEYVNSQFTKRTGYTKEEVIGKNPRFLSSGKHSIEDFELLWSTMLAGKTFKGEFLNKTKNGIYYWEHQTNTPIKNEVGEITNFLSIREDISLLKESELRLKTLVESSPNPIFFKDGKGRWLEVNKAGLEMFDLQDADYQGKTDRELIAYSKFYEEALLECERTDEIAWEQKKPMECEKIVSNIEGVEKILDIVKVPLFHHDGSRKALVTITNDITHLKKIQQELLNQNQELRQLSDELSEKNRLLFDSQSKFKNLFEQSPVSLWEEDFYEVKQLLIKKKAEIGDLKAYLDENQDFLNECISKIKILNVNEKTFELFKVESLGELTALLKRTNTKKSYEVLKKELLSLASNKKEFTHEAEFTTTDGKTIATIIKSVAIDDVGKTIVSIIDITELKKAEQELLKSKEKAEESDRLKTEFINNMSHEIRTPMNGILGFSQFLEDPNLSVEKRKHFVNIIQNSGNQLLHIIDDILEISRLGTKQVKVQESQVCINDLLLELFSIFDIKAKEKKTPLYFKKELSDEKSTLSTDKTKLVKILSNLLENALKFTNNGFIEFGYHLKKDREPAELEFYVKDTGIGIKPENQEIIFDRFSQAEKDLSKNVGGLGLGLSIAKENAELLGGKIRVESEFGKGAAFFVTIPYKPVNLGAKITDQKIKSTNKQTKCTILIAEDEEVN